MLRVIRSSENILAMSKLSEKYADKSITGDFGKFIYFSAAQHSVGPRIKFYGGSNDTSTRNSPAMSFTKDGASSIIGDPKKYPLINKDSYVQKIETFVNKFTPLLLLVWYGHLDEADLQKYFEGSLKWDKLMSYIEVPEDVPAVSCKSISELDEFCIGHDLYTFARRRNN